MLRVVLQAGHSATETPFRTGGGGAPGEAEWNSRLVRAVGAILTAAGVDVVLVGAWMNNGVVTTPPVEATRPAALFFSSHYDAAVYGPGRNTGAFADHAQGEAQGAESLRFIALWETAYFAPYPRGTGLVNATQRRNPNTAQYYGYRATPANTPSVLVEHGVGARGVGEDAWLLWDHLDHIAALDARAILQFLGLAVPLVVTPVEDEDMALVADLTTKLEGLEGYASALRDQLAALREEIAVRTTERDVGAAAGTALRVEVAALQVEVKAVVAPLESRIAELEVQVREAMALAGKATAQRPTRIELQYVDGSLGYVPEGV